MQIHFRGADCRDNRTDRLFQIVCVSVFLADDLFPVPLVDVDGVEIVEFLVSADGVHVGVKSFSDPEAVIPERHALPLGEGLDDLRLCSSVLDVEGDFAFITVQVIVQAGGCLQKQRRGNTVKLKGGGQRVSELALDDADCLLGIILRKKRMISVRNNDMTHRENLFL